MHLGVTRFGVVHGRTQVAQAPARRQDHFAGESGELDHHIRDGRAINEVIIDITALGLIAAAARGVIEIKERGRQVIVENTKGLPGGGLESNIVGNMLIQRGAVFGTISGVILVSEVDLLASLIDGTGHFAEAVIMLAVLVFQKVADLLTTVLEAVGVRAVGGQHQAVLRRPGDTKILKVDDHLQVRCVQGDLIFAALCREGRFREGRKVVPIAAFARHVAVFI